MRKLKFSLMVAGLAALFVTVGAAKAAAATFNLTSDHCTGGCGAAGTVFGTVTLLQNGTAVDITVHLNTGFGWAKTGAADDQMFKFNATGVVVGDITIDPIAGKTLAASTGAYNGDGTGQFGWGIACTSCGGGLSDTFTNDLVFHVASATIFDLTHKNNLNNVFVVDIGNLAAPTAPFGGNTGPIDATVCITNCGSIDQQDFPGVPEPTTLVLLGSGLLIATKGIRRRMVR